MRLIYFYTSLFLLLILLPGQLFTQTLSATVDSSDAHIDLNWMIPVDPCLLDYGLQYDELAIQIKADDGRGLIEEVKYTDLSGFYGPPQPSFEVIMAGENDNQKLRYSFADDSVIQKINNYTLEFWINLDASSANLIEDVTGNGYIQLEQQGDQYVVKIKKSQDNQPLISSPLPIKKGKWQHLAFTGNGLNQTQIYLNGDFKATVDVKIPLTSFAAIPITSRFFFAEFRVWDRLRTKEEIKANYLNIDNNQANLIIRLQATPNFDQKFEDNNGEFTTILLIKDQASSYDGKTQTFQLAVVNQNALTIVVPYIPTPDYKPIIGKFRDRVGPNKLVGYTLELELKGGNDIDGDAACGKLETVGKTLVYQKPDLLTVSTNEIERIDIGWRNNSDWITRYLVRRTNAQQVKVDLPVDLSSLNRGILYAYADAFKYGSPTSIKNGAKYTYALVGIGPDNAEFVTQIGTSGSTIPINLQASDISSLLKDRVNLTWNNLSAYTDKLEILRKGEVIFQLASDQTNYADLDPEFGVAIEYELKLFRAGKAIVSDYDQGGVPPNGRISGKVLTRSGEFPVKGIVLELTSKTSGNKLTATTNNQGTFLFDDLAYGIVDTFTLRALPQSLHDYSPNGINISISKVNPIAENIILFDAYNYNPGFTQIEVTSFTSTSQAAQDQVGLNWKVTSNAANTIIEVLRDATLIFQDASGNKLNGSFVDQTGAPGKQYDYIIKAYQINGSQLSNQQKKIKELYPEVAAVPVFTATLNAGLGLVELEWMHTSDNNSGYRIYRNNALIAELPASTNNYTDLYPVPGAVTEYSITSFRTVEDLTTESEATNSVMGVFTCPHLPAPKNVNALADNRTPAIKITWEKAAVDNYNFTGYQIARIQNGTSTILATILKDRLLEWTDYQGDQNTSYQYEVRSFLQSPVQTLKSDPVTTNTVVFPVLPAPTNVFPKTSTQKESTGQKTALVTLNVDWAYDTKVINFDGFILYGSGGIGLDTIAATARTTIFYANYAAEIAQANTQIKLSAYRLVNGKFFESEPAGASQQSSDETMVSNAPIEKASNFTASNDLRTHVKLCWQNENLADQIITRDGIVLDTVNNDVESYYDYTAMPGKIYTYTLTGNLNGQKSFSLVAKGSLLSVKKVSGMVYNEQTGMGVHKALITMSITPGGPGIREAFTDSTGYYEITGLPQIIGQEITLTAAHPNAQLTIPLKRFQIGLQDDYEVDFGDAGVIPASFDSIAAITSFIATPDPVTRRLILHWNTSSDRYDGIELLRGTDVLAFIPKQTERVFLDSLVGSGVKYGYLTRTYQNSSRGRLVSAYVRTDALVPNLLPATNLSATPDTRTNRVVVQWSHKYDNHTYYQVLRNDEPVAQVPVGGALIFTDRDGSPGETYRYTVIAVEELTGLTGNTLLQFSQPADIEVVYPLVAQVQNLTLAVAASANPVNLETYSNPPLTDNNYTLNFVQVNWNYPDTSSAVDGFNIYRNGLLVGMANKTERTFADFSGIPNNPSEYEVSARIKTSIGLLIESNRRKSNINFPKIAQPFDLFIQRIVNDGTVQLSFSYPVYQDQIHEVDKFYIYRNTTPSLTPAQIIDTIYIQQENAGAFVFEDRSGIPGTEYYYGIQAEAVKNAVQYTSAITSPTRSVVYPDIAPPINLVGNNHVAFNIIEFTWDYANENSIDRFELDPGNGEPIVQIEKNLRKHRYKVVNPMPAVGHTFTLSAVKRIQGIVYKGSVSIHAQSGSEVLEQAVAGSGVADELGWDIKMTDNWLVVSAPLENGAGAVHIYKYNLPAFSFEEFEVIRGSEAGERFGHSVDLSGNFLVVGAPQYQLAQGRIAIYEFRDGSWLTDPPFVYQSNYDSLELGFDVSISDDLVVASMANYPNRPDNPTSRPADFNYYTARHVNGTWQQIKLNHNNPFKYAWHYEGAGSGDSRYRAQNWGIPGTGMTRYSNEPPFSYYAQDPLPVTAFREGQSIVLHKGRLVTTRVAGNPLDGFFKLQINAFTLNGNTWTTETLPEEIHNNVVPYVGEINLGLLKLKDNGLVTYPEQLTDLTNNYDLTVINQKEGTSELARATDIAEGYGSYYSSTFSPSGRYGMYTSMSFPENRAQLLSAPNPNNVLFNNYAGTQVGFFNSYADFPSKLFDFPSSDCGTSLTNFQPCGPSFYSYYTPPIDTITYIESVPGIPPFERTISILDTTGFGKAIAVNETHLAIGAPGRSFPFQPGSVASRYPYDNPVPIPGNGVGALTLVRFQGNEGYFASVTATDGTKDNTEISWTLDDSKNPGSDYKFKIYRDEELIGEVAKNVRSFNESQSIADKSAIPGKRYTYTVVLIQNYARKQDGELVDIPLEPASDEGYSKAIGRISGSVLVKADASIGVPGVTITATSILSDQFVQKSVVTNAEGKFFLEDLLFEEDGNQYVLTASYKNHQFDPVKPVLLSIQEPNKTNVLLFDNTSFVVKGTVSAKGSACGLEDQVVRYYQLVNGQEMLKDSARTDEKGYYSLIVNPDVPQLERIRISIADVQTKAVGHDSTMFGLVRHQYRTSHTDNPRAVIKKDPAGIEITNFTNLQLISQVDFKDELEYSIPITVQNGCGNRVDNTLFKVRIFTLDLCVDTTIVTRINGKTEINLTPKDYQIVVTGIADATPSQLGVKALDYLKVRPFYLKLAQLHQEAALNEPVIPSVEFTYHTRADIVFNSSAFSSYFCGETTQPAITAQGQSYRMNFSVVENHDNNTCDVKEGYLVIRNSGALNAGPTRLDFQDGFPVYEFTAAGPNLISPYIWTINVQYFSKLNSLLAERAIPMIVEGSTALPGAGLNIKLDKKDGEIQLPLFILRDPPGDGSFASIEKGSVINSQLSFNSGSSASGGFFADIALAFATIGFFTEQNIQYGTNSATTGTFGLNIETTETISTSDDADFTGRAADVIVGLGLASSYGVIQGVRVVKCDSIQLYTDLGFSADGVSTEWNYTVGFIEQLIKQLKQDSLLLREGSLTYRYPDGTLYREQDAITKVGSEIASWQKILEYHDINTLPHYILCTDNAYRDRLSEANKARYDAWRNAFCGEIGVYKADKFVLNDRIIWTDDLINKYRNVTAVLETFKGADIGAFDNGDLDFSMAEYQKAERALTRLYENATDTSIVNLSISGGLSREFSYTAARAASTDIEFNRFYTLDGAAGLYTATDTKVGFGLITSIVEGEGKVGAAFSSEANFQTNQVEENSKSSNITVSLKDDDQDDNFSVTIIPSPMSNHTPYFALTGGQSSCPTEKALSSRDNGPLAIDNFSMVLIDPETGATGTSLAKNNIPADGFVQFKLKIKNITNLNLNRIVDIYATNNIYNARIEAANTQLGGDGKVRLDITGSEEKELFISIARNALSNFYEFPNIRIGLQPYCDGEDTRFELQSAAFVDITVRFQQPCSQISLGAPLNQFVVNRVNTRQADDREHLAFKIYDLEVNNPNLRNVKLQYRLIGADADWVEFTEIPVADIKAAYSTFALDDIPFYYFDWDITGQYDRYPDGTYLVRAVSNCGATGGQIYSEEITGTIRRSALILKGIPEPADQVWVNGDEISASYSRDLSCGLISTPSAIVNNFQLLDRTAGDVPVAFDLICNNGKLILQPKEDLRVYDGHTLVAIYRNVPDVSGNVAEDIEWPFKVIAQQADWQEQEIVVRLYQGDQITKKALIYNTTGNQVTGLNLTRADASSSAWLTMDPMNNLVIPAAGQTITFSIDGNRAPGDYTDDIAITGMAGRIPVIKVKATILPPPPATENIVKRENEMELVANWRFEDFNLTSVDSLDQIQVLIDGQVRGLANIKAVGPFYAAIIKIQGNASDAGKMLQFRVWHGNALTLYEGVALSGLIQFSNGTKVGSLDAPELIIVKDAIVVSINEVRQDNVFKLSSYPNPFAEATNIRFELDQPKDALIQIFNVMGQMVYEEKGYYASGEHQIRFNSTAGMAGGMYYVLMQSDGQIATHRMILIR